MLLDKILKSYSFKSFELRKKSLVERKWRCEIFPTSRYAKTFYFVEINLLCNVLNSLHCLLFHCVRLTCVILFLVIILFCTFNNLILSSAIEKEKQTQFIGTALQMTPIHIRMYAVQPFSNVAATYRYYIRQHMKTYRQTGWRIGTLVDQLVLPT